MKIIEGKLNGRDMKVAIVASRFNEFITSKLIDGAVDSLTRHEVDKNSIDLFWVPGAFEIPLITKKLIEIEKYDGIICLGAVIKGDTPHFDYVCNEVSKGIATLSMQYGKPVIFGVLTTDSIEQAIQRAGVKSGNKGFDCATSLIETVNLISNI